tara:strand:+ start:1809 stop:2087 length:279 start_codon:yes stop_codon:yes gene_type:complete
MGNLCFKDDDDSRLNNYPGYTGSPVKGNTPPKGNSPIEGAGRGYICYNGMDDNNKKAMDVWSTEGMNGAIKHMMTGADGKPRSYAEMRSLYG